MMPKIFAIFVHGASASRWCYGLTTLCMCRRVNETVTIFDVMLRTPLENEPSTRVSTQISAMSLLPYVVPTLPPILFNFLSNVCVCCYNLVLITRARKGQHIGP